MADRSNWWLVGLGVLGFGCSALGTALAFGGRDQRLSDVEACCTRAQSREDQAEAARQADHDAVTGIKADVTYIKQAVDELRRRR